MPSHDNASEDCLVTVTECHILAAAMKIFGMSSLGDKPSEKYFQPMQKRQLLLLAVKDLIMAFVNLLCE